ncbi:MAG: DUF3313 family protein [Planctomycetota bacterium]|nr:DUF3313 family protein [Planctomycetota bacterium]MDA1106538.1 DUF3313 family protein [Planctomycetota bacterium]
MRTIPSISVIAASLASLALAACGGDTPLAPAGVLMQSWPDQIVGSVETTNKWIDQSANWASYTSFQLGEIQVCGEAAESLSTDDAQTLVDSLGAQLRKAFSVTRQDSSAAGAGTLVVKADIVQAVANQPVRNISPLSQIRGAGYGTVTIEIQVTDGGTGELLLAFRQTGKTKRFSAEKLTWWGSAEKYFGEWAKDIASACGG